MFLAIHSFSDLTATLFLGLPSLNEKAGLDKAFHCGISWFLYVHVFLRKCV